MHLKKIKKKKHCTKFTYLLIHEGAIYAKITKLLLSQFTKEASQTKHTKILVVQSANRSENFTLLVPIFFVAIKIHYRCFTKAQNGILLFCTNL